MYIDTYDSAYYSEVFIYLREMKTCAYENLSTVALFIIIQIWKPTMNEYQNVKCPYNRDLLSNKREQATNMSNHINGSSKSLCSCKEARHKRL